MSPFYTGKCEPRVTVPVKTWHFTEKKQYETIAVFFTRLGNEPL